MEGKIQSHHLSKQAYVYLRQSSMGQVRFNQESTQRQYALQNKAQQLGWDQRNIKVLDGDLGISGTQSVNREDFKILVADVSMGKVGAVFALEASRLSRSCTDWHRLLELCAMTETLIIDEDGCYNPSDFNDQLLLGLKGTMSQAELHFIRARLLGGKINKAKRGELRFPLPVGFYYNDQNHTEFDTDEQVCKVIELLFKIFKEKGSAYGVAHYFGQNKILFPKRAYGGVWKGKLVWGPLSHERVLKILQNPSYAGVYVYGRYKYQKKLSPEGKIQGATICLPMDSWPIMIKNHHPGYISWEEYLENQKILNQNRTNAEENVTPLAAREGMALLQGLLICSSCGHRLTIRYTGNGGIHPQYQCNLKKREGIGQSCFSLSSHSIDKAISEKILDVINPVQIKIAIKAFEELEQRSHALEKQWLMKIERANYESQLCQRRYEEVDPSNRLVASTLEKNWDNALTTLEEIRSQYDEYKKKNVLAAPALQKDNILSLAKDLPRLWKASSTNSKDRKRILRLLIKDITVEKIKEKSKAILHICWQGGAVEDMEVDLPQKVHTKWRHSDKIIKRVKKLALTLTDKEIVEIFKQEGLRTRKNNPYTIKSIKWLRFKYKIPSPLLKKENELTINEIAEKFNVSHYVVRYWIDHNMVNARRIGSKIWGFIDENKEIELRNKVENSLKILIAREKSQTKIVRGVL